MHAHAALMLSALSFVDSVEKVFNLAGQTTDKIHTGDQPIGTR